MMYRPLFGLRRCGATECVKHFVKGIAWFHAVCMLLAFTCLTHSTKVGWAGDVASHERSFLRALEIFDSATSPTEYLESARVLESIIADGVKSGAVYYNLGNAYFRAGEYGRAVLNFRKAIPYRPRDPYLQANLQTAIAASPGRLGIIPTPWWKHVLFWTTWISYPTKCYVVIMLLVGAAVLLVIAYLTKYKWMYWYLLAAMSLAIALGIDIAVQYRDAIESRRAVIVRETIARKGTGETYEPAFDRALMDGAEFQVIGETGEWTMGHFEGIGDGWVRNEFLAR